MKALPLTSSNAKSVRRPLNLPLKTSTNTSQTSQRLAFQQAAQGFLSPTPSSALSQRHLPLKLNNTQSDFFKFEPQRSVSANHSPQPKLNISQGISIGPSQRPANPPSRSPQASGRTLPLPSPRDQINPLKTNIIHNLPRSNGITQPSHRDKPFPPDLGSPAPVSKSLQLPLQAPAQTGHSRFKDRISTPSHHASPYKLNVFPPKTSTEFNNDQLDQEQHFFPGPG